VKLSTLVHGTGTPFTFLHGFTQTKESWLPVVESLSVAIEATLLDCPGHGESPTQGRTLSQTANDVAESTHSGILVGYSMGARIALHTALQFPDIVQGLVLISGTPGLRTESERNDRRSSDEALAIHIENIGTQQFISEWLSNPMFQGLPTELADIPRRCSNAERGLADSLRFAGTGTQEPLWDELKSLAMPVLIVTGDKDEKFTQIAQEMTPLISQAEHHVMNNVGHTCHLEDVRQFCDVLENWFLRL
jgi:2-succinyl-6-hydroxy-2,4-cyclohexadiene-1-carboxylate synthase